jgi:hypothetical protein
MVDGKAIIAGLIGLVVAVTIAGLVTAAVFRAAIAFYNKMVGGAGSVSSVPEPSFGKMLGIAFAAILVNGVVGSIVSSSVVGGAAIGGMNGKEVELFAKLISLPFNLLAMAGVLSSMLPTTFGRAFLVTLCYLLICFLIFVVLAVIFFGIMFAMKSL